MSNVKFANTSVFNLSLFHLHPSLLYITTVKTIDRKPQQCTFLCGYLLLLLVYYYNNKYYYHQ